MKLCRILVGLLVGLALGSCAHYPASDAVVNISALRDPTFSAVVGEQPALLAPARMALVRIQALGRGVDANSGYDSGRFSVVAAHNADTVRIAALPSVRDVVYFNPLLVPPTLGSVRDLRVLAAQLQADVLLIYTIGTAFRRIDGDDTVLSDLSFGWLREKKLEVTSSAAGMLVDVRSGFVYGLLDSNAQMIRRESLLRGFNWEQINLLQLRTERETQGRLIDEFEQLWHTIPHTDVQLPFNNNDAASRTFRHREIETLSGKSNRVARSGWY